MASPVFFIKKDGTLWLVQDYRALNTMTVKNTYLLPLISKLINKLRGAKYFTKLDIQWGFNNVQMKEGDKWKAAFQTNWGLFKPLVMFFGLCNSLATFQTMMDKIFNDLIIHVENFKPNLTVHVQPKDQDIIQCFKALYCAKFIQQAINQYDEGITPANQLQAIVMVRARSCSFRRTIKGRLRRSLR